MDILLKLGNFRKSILPPDADKSEKFFSLLNFSIPFLLGCYVFVNALSMSALKELCYYLSILALMILLVFKKTNFTLRSPLTAGLALFSVWAVLGLFTTLDFSNTLHDLRGYLLEYLIVLYLLINFYNSPKRLELLAIIIIASATIFSIGGIILYYFIEGHAFNERFGVTFKEMYTGWMCFTTVFAALLSLQNTYRTNMMTHKIFYFICFGILSLATILNQSRGVMIAFFVALLIMSIYRKKTILIVVTIIITTILFLPTIKERFGSQNVIKDPRSQIYPLAMEVIKDYPIAGVGYGGEIFRKNNMVNLDKYNASLPEKYRQEGILIKGEKKIFNATHNAFLDVAVRTGLIGLALCCSILLTAFWMLVDVFRRRREEFFRSWSICLFACFTAYLIQAFFNDALYGAQGIILYFHLAMIAILWNLSRKNLPSGY
jgi:O-antigen ligase